MKSQFAQVLANESQWLAGVSDRAQLAQWRHRVVKEVMTPGSPYAVALRNTRDAHERAEFLSTWRDLIADAIGRVVSQDEPERSVAPGRHADDVLDEPRKIAVLVLAALHGGCTLSHVAQDQWPLDAALEIALAPFASSGEPPTGGTTHVPPRQ